VFSKHVPALLYSEFSHRFSVYKTNLKATDDRLLTSMPSYFQWSNSICETDLSHIHGCQYMPPCKPGVMN